MAAILLRIDVKRKQRIVLYVAAKRLQYAQLEAILLHHLFADAAYKKSLDETDWAQNSIIVAQNE